MICCVNQEQKQGRGGHSWKSKDDARDLLRRYFTEFHLSLCLIACCLFGYSVKVLCWSVAVLSHSKSKRKQNAASWMSSQYFRPGWNYIDVGKFLVYTTVKFIRFTFWGFNYSTFILRQQPCSNRKITCPRRWRRRGRSDKTVNSLISRKSHICDDFWPL